jgi:defect-in-organelle-trafficking protein DotA
VSLLFVSQFVFADSSLTDVAFGSDQVKNYTDISISYLSQILGTVGNVLHGTNGQVLGQMFYVFNTGVLIAAGIWLCYTVLTILLKSSQEGSFSGQNRNAAVIFLKIALGIAFLVPSPSTGYNVLQAVVAKVVVYGVDLADSVWNKTLDYMSDGGTIFSITSIMGDNGNFSDKDDSILKTQQARNAINAITTVLANTTCLYQANSTRMVPAHLIVDNNKYQLQFPGPNDDELTNPGCGYISWDVGNFCSTSAADPTDEMAAKKCSYYQQAIYQVVTDLWQTGLTYANHYPVKSDDNDLGSLTSGLTADDLKTQAQTAIVNAFIDYINLVLPVTRMDNEVIGEQKDFYAEEARVGGWMTAGEFYWKLIQYNEALSKATGNITVPISEKATKPQTAQNVFPPDSSVIVDGTNYKTANNMINDLPSDGSMLTLLQNELHMDGTDLESAMTKTTLHLKDKILAYGSIAGATAAAGPVGGVLMSMFTAPTEDFDSLMRAITNTNRNPLLWARAVGQAMLQLASTYLMTLSAVFSVLGIVGSLVIQVQPLGMGMSTALSTLANVLISILKMMVVPLMFICVLGGVVLAYYLPLYPYFVFLFGCAAFFLNVIEGFLAAPLVALGLTHPEGHDFLGKAEQSLILLLNLFVRPTLMIFGLIVGILVSYVLFELIQHGIMTVFSSINIMGGKGADFGSKLSGLMFLKAAYGTYGFLSSLVLLIILSMYVLLIQQCAVLAFSGIYKFPNKIMRWIGGFEQQDDSAMLAEQQKGIVSQGGGQGAKMATDQVSQAAKGATDKIGEAGKKKQGGG